MLKKTVDNFKKLCYYIIEERKDFKKSKKSEGGESDGNSIERSERLETEQNLKKRR